MKAIKLLKQMKKYFGVSQVKIQTDLDEAIAELEALQNRNCNICKYNKDDVCVNDKSLICADFINNDFCCNKWEYK